MEEYLDFLITLVRISRNNPNTVFRNSYRQILRNISTGLRPGPFKAQLNQIRYNKNINLATARRRLSNALWQENRNLASAFVLMSLRSRGKAS